MALHYFKNKWYTEQLQQEKMQAVEPTVETVFKIDVGTQTRGRGRPRLLDSTRVFNPSKASTSTEGLKRIKKILKKSNKSKKMKPRKYKDDKGFRVSKPRGKKKGKEEEEDDALYCLCRETSSGKMVNCENNLCPLEWFHFKCVGLRKTPKGEWYCPNCRGENSSVRKSIKSILQDLNEYNHQYDKEVAVEMKN